MGIGRFAGFKRLVAAIQRRDFNRAADEMKASRWYRQVGIRAKELCSQMRFGLYQVH